MAKKKTPVAKRVTKKPKSVKAAPRGSKSARKAALKKPSAAQRHAVPKKKAAAKKALPARPKQTAKRTTGPTKGKHSLSAPGKQAVAQSPIASKPRPSAAKPPKVQAPKSAASALPSLKGPAQPNSAPEAPKSIAKPVERKPMKERVVMEFEVHSNPNVLFELLSTPSGFSEWYCDDVDVRGDVFTFKWGNDEEIVTMIGRKAPEVIRFRRSADDDPAAFFEFRIRIDDMTNEVALIVTDHAWPGESGNVRSLWASQIANLTRVLGA